PCSRRAPKPGCKGRVDSSLPSERMGEHRLQLLPQGEGDYRLAENRLSPADVLGEQRLRESAGAAGVEHLTKLVGLVVRQSRRAEHPVYLAPQVTGDRVGDQHGALALAEVTCGRLAGGDRVSEYAEQVVDDL